MGLSTAEKNRRKRERKKKDKEERRQHEETLKQDTTDGQENDKKDEEEVVIEYVVESFPEMNVPREPVAKDSTIPDGLPPAMGGNDAAHDLENNAEDMEAILRRFHQRSAVAAVITDDERKEEDTAGRRSNAGSDEEDDDEDDDRKPMSKRKLREVTRPSVAELKRRVKRPDLVEAHDITAADPDFLIHLKAVSGTVPVPRHWGRKRKYLQGKRGFEKPPFQVS